MNEVTIASPNLFYESLSFLERAYHKEIEYDGNDYEQLYQRSNYLMKENCIVK